MEMIFDFIRNIASFTIFSGLIRLIAPERFKKYINLCLAASLITIMFEPIGYAFKFFAETEYEEATEAAGFTFYYDGSASESVISENYRKALSNGLKGLISDKLTDYVYLSSEFYVDCSPNSVYFGEITRLDVILEENQAQKPFFRVEKSLAQRENEKNSIKKIISDFYNLSQDNINVIVQVR